VLILMQVTFFFNLGLGLGCGPKSGPLLFLIKKLYSYVSRVGKTLVCVSNCESVKRRWVGKSFTDVTYNDSHRGSVKLLLMTYRQLLIMNRGVVLGKVSINVAQATIAGFSLIFVFDYGAALCYSISICT
jgi:hypothetical protein